MCADIFTDKKNIYIILTKNSHVTCQVSGFMYHMSPVTYHLSLIPNATDPHPANSPTMHSRLFCKDPQPKRFWKTPKILVSVVKGGDIIKHSFLCGHCNKKSDRIKLRAHNIVCIVLIYEVWPVQYKELALAEWVSGVRTTTTLRSSLCSKLGPYTGSEALAQVRYIKSFTDMALSK